MTTLDIHFRIIDGSYNRVPYIIEPESTEYTCDGKEGTLCFDGHYYVEDHAPPYQEDDCLVEWKRPNRYPTSLPQKVYMSVKRREKEPYKTEIHENGSETTFYRTIEDHYYVIEIYKRVIHNSTDRLSQMEDSDGEEMTVCFFPTNKQTIYFRVIDELLQEEKLSDRIDTI